jgi:hypothetical protein
MRQNNVAGWTKVAAVRLLPKRVYDSSVSGLAVEFLDSFIEVKLFKRWVCGTHFTFVKKWDLVTNNILH